MRDGDPVCEFNVRVKKVTDAALCCHVEGVEGDVWFPKSQIDAEQSAVSEVGDVGSLIVSEWVALQKDLL